MPRLIPPPIIIPSRHQSSSPSPISLSPISTPGIPETPLSNAIFYIENDRICTIRNDTIVYLLIFYHRDYAGTGCLYATSKDVRDKRQCPLMRYSLIWGTSKWNPVQCCSLNELNDIVADLK